MSKKLTDNEPSRDDLRLQTAIKFLNSGKNFRILYNLLEKSRYGDKKVSIRTLEWFVVNYAEGNDISYNLEEAKSSSSEMFQVNKSYQDQLRIFTKKAFDPFCRGEQSRDFRKKFTDGKKEVVLTITTNLAQLNFFQWAIGNRVLDYIVDNYKTIMKCKKIAEKQRRKAKNSRKMIDTSTSDTESADEDKEDEDDASDRGVGSSTNDTKRGSRRKRQGEVVVRHFSRGIVFQMP
jgi:hypothetical protein